MLAMGHPKKAARQNDTSRCILIYVYIYIILCVYCTSAVRASAWHSATEEKSMQAKESQ